MTVHANWLFDLSQWFLLPVAFAILVVLAEIGLRLGARAASADGATSGNSITTLEGAALGLLTLMISFTFSTALDRFDTRKAYVLDEANAIGTATLRARTLPEPYAADTQRLLESYLDIRLKVPELGRYALVRVADPLIKIQDELWQKVVAVSAQDSRSIPSGLFIEAMNDLIDLHEKRLTADRNHVPQAIFLLLFGLGCASIGLAAYNAGVSGSHKRLPMAIMSLLIVVVIIQIADLDRPQRGLITVGQEPMMNLAKDTTE